MDIKIVTNLDDSLDPNLIEVLIKAANNSEELQNVINNIQSISHDITVMIGKKENKIYILRTKDIVVFYASNNHVYCKTMEEEFQVDKRMYELEEIGQGKFIRISKSCIVNLDFVTHFDLTYLGNIIVKLKNGDTQNVSKRKIPEMMRFLHSLK